MVLQFYAQVKELESPNRGRFYIHNTGSEVFGQNKIVSARREFERVRNYLANQEKHYPWMIGILSGDCGERVVDLFMYSGDYIIRDWPGNPEISYAQFRNGNPVEKPKRLTVEDALIVLGRETEHRRRSKNLEEYLTKSPGFGNNDVKMCI